MNNHIQPQDSRDPTCRHPSVFLADTSSFDTAWDDYELMMGCVMCSQWVAAPRTWQTFCDSFTLRGEERGPLPSWKKDPRFR
jgi:hypothetical protein